MAAAIAGCDRSSAERNAAAADSTSTSMPAPAAAAAPADSVPAAALDSAGNAAPADTAAPAATPKATPPKPKAAGPEFAAELGINPKALHVMQSGLRMVDVTVGTGMTASEGREVAVHYTGWLTNGKKFDSSRDRGEPFTFHLGAGDVIRGWDEGVAGMKIGGRRKLVIPADLGYGDTGAPPDIPPGATLVFDVELLEVR